MANFKKGEILSETSFYTVVEDKGTKVAMTERTTGKIVTLDKNYIDTLCSSLAVVEEKESTRTSIQEILLSSPNIVCEVYYRKANKVKSGKAYQADKLAAYEEVEKKGLGNLKDSIFALIDNPPLPYVPGDMRVARGFHTGKQDNAGRVHFYDMEKPKTTVTGEEQHIQIDPRTIEYLIVGGVKYIVK